MGIYYLVSDNKWGCKDTKRITKTAWFGKKVIGWGLRPISIEGWLVTIIFSIAIIANHIHNKRSGTGYLILAAIMIIFFIIAYLTSDAPGSEFWDKFRTGKK